MSETLEQVGEFVGWGAGPGLVLSKIGAPLVKVLGPQVARVVGTRLSIPLTRIVSAGGEGALYGAVDAVVNRWDDIRKSSAADAARIIAEDAGVTAGDFAKYAGAFEGLALVVKGAAASRNALRAARDALKPEVSQPPIHTPTVEESIAAVSPARGRLPGVHPTDHPIVSPETVLNHLAGEAGSVTLPASMERTALAIRDAAQLITESRKDVQVSRDIGDSLYRLKTNHLADEIRAKKFIEAVRIDPADAEALYHFDENPKEVVSPQLRQAYDTFVKPLADDSRRMYEKLRGRGVPIPEAEYTPRFVADRGGILDRLISGEKRSLSGSLLSRTSSTLKHRTVYAIEGDAGTRDVALLNKDGRLVRYRNGTREDLGVLNLKTREQLLEKQVKPLEQRVRTLEQQLRTLKSVKSAAPGALERIEAELAAVTADLTQTANNVAPGEIEKLQRAQRVLTAQLQAAQSAGRGDVWLQQRIGTLEKHLSVLDEGISSITRRFDPSHLSEKVFVGGDGAVYRLSQATTREIEAHTPIRYHKNVLANRLMSWLELRRAERASDFLEGYKSSPEFAEVAKPIGEIGTPSHWRVPKGVDQFRGYAMEPRVAAEMEAFVNQARTRNDWVGALESIGSFLRTSIFFNPLIHIPNIGIHWIGERGATPFVTPHGYARLGRSFARAFNALKERNQDYLSLLEHGAPMMAETQQQPLHQAMLKLMAGELEQNPSALAFVGRALGYADPRNLVKAIYRFSGKATWWMNDLLTMEAIYERMERGRSMPEAIREVGKHIPNYRIPATVLGSEKIAQGLRSKVFMFMPYHYGALRSYGEMLRSLAVGSLHEKAETLDRVAVMALVGLIGYPMMDRVAQWATGDERVHLRRAGSITFPYNVVQLAKSRISPWSFEESVATPSVGAKLAGQLVFNRNLFTGRALYDPEDLARNPMEAAKDVLREIGMAVSPLGYAERIRTGTLDPKAFMVSLFGVQTQRTTPANRTLVNLMYTSRPFQQHKMDELVRQKHYAEAKQVADEFNLRLIEEAREALQEAGHRLPTEELIDRLRPHFLRVGSAEQLQRRERLREGQPIERIVAPR